MPRLASITATFFINLINRLGVRPPPDEGFLISNIVQPVSIVDSDVTLSATVGTQVLDAGFSTGEQGNPAANTVLADSGAVTAAGNYSVVVMMSCIDSASTNQINIQRRDAANAANIWEFRNYALANSVGIGDMRSFRLSLAAGERVRVVNGAATSAGSKYFAILWLAPVS